jgi:hypothetical protein
MHIATKTATLAALALSLLAAGSAAAQQPTPPAPKTPATAKSSAAKPAAARHARGAHENDAAALRAAAKISEDSARGVALAQVPNGKVRSGELEREHGRLIYSFDLEVPGKSGIEEVNVDAETGAVVAHEHEGPKAERAEKAQEAREHVAAKKGAHPAPAAHAYHVAKRLPVGGDGGWDYLTVDTAGHRLYVTRGTHVMVVDTDRDSVVGDIPDTPGVHGVALAPELGRGFTSNGRDSTVTIFDLWTLAKTGSVNVGGRNPDAILYEPTTRRVFALNHSSGTATAIDAATGAVVGTIPIGGVLEFGVADGRGRVFVNVEDRGEIVAFDPRTLAVTARWPLAPCEEPSGLAMDRARGRLFAGCSNKLMAVVDAGSGRVVATVPVGEGVDANAFDPATRLAFSSNGDGTLTVVREDSPDHFTVVGNVPTERGARTMALDERTHRIYMVSARFGPPPAPTAERPHPRPPVVPGSFTVLVLER